MRKPIWIGFGIGIISNLIFFVICAYLSSINHPLFEHNDPMPNIVLLYGAFYLCTMFPIFFIKRYFALGLLIALFVPILIFIVLQILVTLSYWKIIP